MIMLYIFIKFCQSISKAFKVTDLNSRTDPKVVENVDGRMYKRKTGSLYCAMPGAGATKMKQRQFHKVYTAKFSLTYLCIGSR